MKILKYCLSAALIAGFALTASCGGSNSTDDSASTAGDSSSAGSTSTAGDSSSAGSTSSAGSVASGGETNEQGGSSEGGSIGERGGASNGGASHGGAGGAAATNPPGCPAAAPTVADACTTPTNTQTRCDYTGLSCRCRPQVGGGNGGGAAGAGGAAAAGGKKWECDVVPVCPATKPATGEACTDAEACAYKNDGACLCGQNKKWQCYGGNGGGAGGAGAGGASGTAGASGAGAGDANGGTTCPTTKPKTGGECKGDGACGFASGGCLCDKEKWICL